MQLLIYILIGVQLPVLSVYGFLPAALSSLVPVALLAWSRVRKHGPVVMILEALWIFVTVTLGWLAATTHL